MAELACEYPEHNRPCHHADMDPFDRAIHHPRRMIEPLAPFDQQYIIREGRYALAAHTITSLMLRRAGEESTIRNHVALAAAEAARSQALVNTTTTRRRLQEHDATIDSLTPAATPYRLVLGRVMPYQTAYDTLATRRGDPERGGQETLGELRERLHDTLYAPTEHLSHVLLDDVRGLQAFGERAIVVDRVMRLVLLGEQQVDA